MRNHENQPASDMKDQELLDTLLDQASAVNTDTGGHPSRLATRRVSRRGALCGFLTAGAALLAGGAAAVIPSGRAVAATESRTSTALRRQAPAVQHRDTPRVAAHPVQSKADLPSANNASLNDQTVSAAHAPVTAARADAPEANVAPQAAAAYPAPGTTYVVQSGDTLSSIAYRSYGYASFWPAIYEANRYILSSPHTIYPGQVLTIPVVHSPPPPIGTGMGQYTVRAGDTLSGIAYQAYGNAGYWPAIYQANQGVIANPDIIYPGTVLTIPSLY